MELLYTQRNNMRVEVKKNYDITYDKYKIILDCCKKYLVNLSWKYPHYCSDGNFICGLNNKNFVENLKFDIPDLLINEHDNLDSPDEYDEDYNQFGLLDFIEYIAQNVKDIKEKNFHEYFRHDHLIFVEDSINKNCIILQQFTDEINRIFEKTGLLYNLNDECEIERIVQNDILTDEIIFNVHAITEYGIKELLLEAIQLYKNPRPQTQHLAVEKIWDAFERLKTYYSSLDKKGSANKIVTAMANNNTEFFDLFNAEFEKLTNIGNKYRIRHHETSKTDIIDNRYFDYFFNRCLALIALAIQYLE